MSGNLSREIVRALVVKGSIALAGAIIAGAIGVLVTWTTPYVRGLRLLADARTEAALRFWWDEGNRGIVEGTPDRIDGIDGSLNSLEDRVSTLEDQVQTVTREVRLLGRPERIVEYREETRVFNDQVEQGGRAVIEMVISRFADTVVCELLGQETQYWFVPEGRNQRYSTWPVPSFTPRNATTQVEVVQFAVRVPRTLPAGQADFFIRTFYRCPFQTESEPPLTQTSPALPVRIVRSN